MANLKGPFLNSWRMGGYSFPIFPSGKITGVIPSNILSDVFLKALKADILLSRLKGISILLKYKDVSGFSSNSSFPR